MGIVNVEDFEYAVQELTVRLLLIKFALQEKISDVMIKLKRQ